MKSYYRCWDLKKREMIYGLILKSGDADIKICGAPHLLFMMSTQMPDVHGDIAHEYDIVCQKGTGIIYIVGWQECTAGFRFVPLEFWDEPKLDQKIIPTYTMQQMFQNPNGYEIVGNAIANDVWVKNKKKEMRNKRNGRNN